jgi:cytochrome c oxidase subunit 1
VHGVLRSLPWLHAHGGQGATGGRIRPAGGRGSPPSTTRRSASCTASSPSVLLPGRRLEALLIRSQLAHPDNTVLSADLYNQVFTMHATTMIFLFVMPMARRSNYLIPLQIGARDVAFPRSTPSASGASCSAASSSTPRGSSAAAPTVAGSCTPPNAACCSRRATASTSGHRPADHRYRLADRRDQPDRHRHQHAGPGHDAHAHAGVHLDGLVTQFLLLFAMPVITVALFLLIVRPPLRCHVLRRRPRRRPAAVAAPVLDLRPPRGVHHDPPGFGIVSEVLPVFSRKPLFGYKFVVFSGIAIGFIGWGVWAHHMFASASARCRWPCSRWPRCSSPCPPG